MHGTFSSTAGSFGALAATPDGRVLLKQARERYDAVIGFDHSTLAETPDENAIDLVERWNDSRSQCRSTRSRTAAAVSSSAVWSNRYCHQRHTPEIWQAVFVAVPNHGTLFAEPANWKTLIDIYTNLSMGAFALLKLLPAAAPTAHILSGDRLGAGCVREVPRRGHCHGGCGARPAAQAPNGPFVRALNETGPGQPCRIAADISR